MFIYHCFLLSNVFFLHYGPQLYGVDLTDGWDGWIGKQLGIKV